MVCGIAASFALGAYFYSFTDQMDYSEGQLIFASAFIILIIPKILQYLFVNSRPTWKTEILQTQLELSLSRTNPDNSIKFFESLYFPKT